MSANRFWKLYKNYNFWFYPILKQQTEKKRAKIWRTLVVYYFLHFISYFFINSTLRCHEINGRLIKLLLR